MEERKAVLREFLAQDPADIAEVLADLSQDQATDLVHHLFLSQAAADPLGEMDADDSAELVAQLDRTEASKILSRMDPDDAVDLLLELPEDVQQELLSRLSRSDARVLTDLLAYPPDSAGGLMSPEVVTVSLAMSAQAAINYLRQRVQEAETIYYVYAVDEEHHLLGVLSLRDIALADPTSSLHDLVIRDAVTVPVDADAEDVAHTFDKYDYFALPVVDNGNRLLGIITFDDIIDVIREEATEDIYRAQGVPLEERIDTSLAESLKLRLPWLSFNMLTAFLAAAVVGFFESTIATVAALAILMPIIAGQGGNAGMQTVTIITRGIALGEVPKGIGWKLVAKELLLGILNGIALGIMVGIVAFLWKGSLYLGLVAFLAMVSNLIVAGVAGAVIPLTLRALRLDPALASSIFLTTATDVLGFASLFVIAIWLLPEI